MSHSQLRCSDAEVESAAALMRWVGSGAGGATRPHGVLGSARDMVKVVRRAPVRSVELTDSESGAIIYAHLRSRGRGPRGWLRTYSVLTIPPPGQSLWSGRRFQAVRTNVRRARQEGITCRELPASERARVLQALDEPECLTGMTAERWWVAEDADGSPVGVAVATVDGEWSMLGILVASGYTARYLLHTHLTEALQAAGVRHLFFRGDPLSISQGLLYLQARLGYEVLKLRVPRRPPGSASTQKASRLRRQTGLQRPAPHLHAGDARSLSGAG